MPPEEQKQPTPPTSSESTPNPTTTETPPSTETPTTPPSTPEAEAAGDKLFDKDKPTEDEKKPEETEEKKDEKTDEAEPLSLDNLTFPEGFDKENPLAGEFVEAMNDKELSAEDRANKLLDIYKRSAESFEEEANKLWLETNEKWQEELVSEIGEQKLEAALSKVGSLIEAFDKDHREAFASANPDAPPREFGKEVREAFTLTGAGNNPAIVKFLFWAADQLGEGVPLSGTPAGGVPLSRADRMYGS